MLEKGSLVVLSRVRHEEVCGFLGRVVRYVKRRNVYIVEGTAIPSARTRKSAHCWRMVHSGVLKVLTDT